MVSTFIGDVLLVCRCAPPWVRGSLSICFELAPTRLKRGRVGAMGGARLSPSASKRWGQFDALFHA
eukprot:217184-Amphidinium_carterae.1